ncbi:efflux RND transporter periplasmic adaptor subunit [Lutibacter sp. HS1-25]|uniref:efflux RND transporter periplasmic adaptor subunit n=1 Tax=Lutibacter sp. HS1-25 TaxID=2485000 RepID=UPI00101190AC|nr:efflux RND transporter periplasmic adaptor subunit [Lutibacter sp. HS1-25]RXP54817.1 efflux RND transporter periplasmic adaptor subunit [Lutibacter sp. HS1-25]
MKKYKNYILGAAILLIGILLGSVFSGGNSEASHNESEHEFVQDPVTQLWTCSMHPQIQMQEPGNCPICGMELIPLETNATAENINADEIVLSEEAYQLANIQTSEVEKANAEKEIRLLGKVQANERNLYAQVSHIPGRIEQLYVNFTGENVVKGQKIARIYSPELISAQKELFEAINSKNVYPALYTAARNKLKLWKLTDNQIDAIEKSGSVQEQIDILSDYSGYVMKRNVEVGDYLKQGSTLFDIANLSSVWVMFDAYEADIEWISIGNEVEYTIQALPGESFKGKVSYIDPFISSGSRIAKVRVEMPNTAGKLLPEMFANGIIKATLKNAKDALIIPKTAVLWTGKRSVVYVKVPHEKTISFTYREITLGADLGNFYIVTNGLKEGEIVATNGVFKIDASAQLVGKQSMMNPTAEKQNLGHAGMDMSGDKKMDTKTPMSDDEMKKMNTTEVETTDHSKMESRIIVSEEFQNQLNNVLNKYINLKDALTKDDATAAQKSASELLKSLGTMDMKLLTNNEAHMHWMTISKEITTSASAISKSTDISIQRNHFKHLSAHFIKAVKLFGVNEKVYEQFCPMADNNNGAYWLSLDEKIKNPYLGTSMPKCGDNKTIIE